MDRATRKNSPRMTACVAVLLAAALLLGGCDATQTAPSSTSSEAQIVARVEEGLRGLSTADEEITLTPLEGVESSTYAFRLNGRLSGTLLVFADGSFGVFSGADATDAAIYTFARGMVCLVYAVLAGQDMNLLDAAEAVGEWFIEPSLQTYSMVGKQVGGYEFAYGCTDEAGWFLMAR